MNRNKKVKMKRKMVREYKERKIQSKKNCYKHKKSNCPPYGGTIKNNWA